MEEKQTGKQLSAAIRARKNLLIGVGAAILVLVLLVCVVIFLLRHEDSGDTSDQPALKVGQTSLSKAQYDKVVASAKEQSVTQEQARAVLTDSLRFQEVARRLKLDVPDYLVAAQAETYTPYADMEMYDKIAAYPRAFWVAVALKEVGGSIDAIYYAPYRDESSKSYAQVAIDTARANITTSQSGPYGFALVSMLEDQDLSFAPGINKTGIYAATNDGQRIYGLTDTELATMTPDRIAETLNIKKEPIDAPITAAIGAVQVNNLSSKITLTSMNAYMLVKKSTVYTKDANIRNQVNELLRDIKEEG